LIGCSQTNGDLLVYENQVRYQPEFLPRGEEAEPVIQRDTPYRWLTYTALGVVALT